MTVKALLLDGTIRTLVSAERDGQGRTWVVDTLGERLPVENVRRYGDQMVVEADRVRAARVDYELDGFLLRDARPALVFDGFPRSGVGSPA